MKIATLLLTFLLGATVAFAQDNVSGKYEGKIAKPDEAITLELKNEGGKISGRLQSGKTSVESTEGSLTNGNLRLMFPGDTSFAAKVEGDKITGEWAKRTFEMKRVPAAAAAAPAASTAPAAAPVNLDGQWEAVADANGQPFPFLLTLKIDGEKVSGASSSQLGEATIKEGTWKDGKLEFSLENQNGIITMNATVIDGKLSGEFDYAGQLQGRWVAVRKNP